MTTERQSAIDLVIDGILGLLPTALQLVGLSGPVAALITPRLPLVSDYLKSHLRDHLAEQLPPLTVPEGVDLEQALYEEVCRLAPATIPAPPDDAPTVDLDDVFDPADSLLTPPRRP